MTALRTGPIIVLQHGPASRPFSVWLDHHVESLSDSVTVAIRVHTQDSVK